MAIGGVAVLEDVLLDMVIADNPTRSYDVTSKAVEDGADISDHMKAKPTILAINGMILGADAWTRLSRIIQYQENSRLVTYTNRVIHTNMSIVDIDTHHGGDTANGLSFTIKLKHVRRARVQQVQMANGVPSPVATKASAEQNAGTRQLSQTVKQSNNKESDARISNIARGFSGGGTGGGLGSGEMDVA